MPARLKKLGIESDDKAIGAMIERAVNQCVLMGDWLLTTQDGKTVTVVINDRGPFVKGRVIDVTPAAARALGFSGLAPVSLAVVKPEKKIKEAGI